MLKKSSKIAFVLATEQPDAKKKNIIGLNNEKLISANDKLFVRYLFEGKGSFCWAKNYSEADLVAITKTLVNQMTFLLIFLTTSIINKSSFLDNLADFQKQRNLC